MRLDVGLVWVIDKAILSLSSSNPGVSYSLSHSMSSWSVLGCLSIIPLPFLHSLCAFLWPLDLW